MRYPSKIDISWDVEELDVFLNHFFMRYSFVLAYWTIEHFLPHCDYSEVGKKDLKRELNQLIIKISAIKDAGEDELRALNLYFKGYIDLICSLQEQVNLLQEHILSRRKRTKKSLKYEIAAIWAIQMKQSNRIPWSNVVRLIEWFYEQLKDTTYGENFKTSHKIKEKSRSFKKQCSPIIKQNFETLVVVMRLFFFDSQKLGLQSIKFTKKSIEINRITAPDGKIGKIKMMFKEGGPYLTLKFEDSPGEEIIPYVSFPNGRVFYQELE